MKRYQYLLSGVLTLVLVMTMSACTSKNTPSTDAGQDQTNPANERGASTEEAVVLGEEEEATVETEREHNLQLSIVGPEGESFEKGQARMYKGLLEGNSKYKSNMALCHWDFYLNRNNEEELFQTLDNRSVLSGESQNVCGFTSTFITERGALRVVLTMTVTSPVDDNLEQVSAERTYVVK